MSTSLKEKQRDSWRFETVSVASLGNLWWSGWYKKQLKRTYLKLDKK